MPPHPISLRAILILSYHLHLGLPSGLFPFSFPTSILYAFLFSPIRATCPAHLILLGLSIIIILSSHLLPKNVKIKIYKTIIWLVFFYGCETWSLPLSEEHRLRVFENIVLRRIFGPKRDEIIGR
jgi:hypothetical protein